MTYVTKYTMFELDQIKNSVRKYNTPLYHSDTSVTCKLARSRSLRKV